MVITLSTIDENPYLASVAVKLLPPQPFGDIVALSSIAVSCILVDTSYQRSISDNGRMRIVRIMRNFDWEKYGVVTLARADSLPDTTGERYIVIDGQHRVIAARHLGDRILRFEPLEFCMMDQIITTFELLMRNAFRLRRDSNVAFDPLGIARIPAVVNKGDRQSQASDFVVINNDATKVGVIDRFRARVVSGDKLACQLAEMMDTLDISTNVAPGTSLKPRQTRAITVLERMMKIVGPGVLFIALEALMMHTTDGDGIIELAASQIEDDFRKTVETKDPKEPKI